MSNNSIRMVMILGLIGDDSIRMSQIPKLGDGINCDNIYCVSNVSFTLIISIETY